MGVGLHQPEAAAVSAPKVATGAAVTTAIAILAAVAASGEKAVGTVKAGYLVLQSMGKDLPVGVYSVLLGLAVGLGLLWNLRRAIPEPMGPARRGSMHMRVLLVDMLAQLATVAAIWLQLRSLNGALIGLAAALLVPWLYRGFAAFLSWAGRRYSLR
jgi:hypothetical protein